MNNQVYILDIKRSPVGKYGGTLKNISITDVASQVVQKLVKDNRKLLPYINKVIVGNVLSAGLGQNPARIVSYKAGLSENIPSYTINHVCGSGLSSIILGTKDILLGEAESILAGGMEGMSNVPFLISDYRFGAKLGNQMIIDSLIYDGIYCSLIDKHMGITAENISKKYKISREGQDLYALKSHQKAVAAINKKKFKDEIVPIKIDHNKFFTTDEQPRQDTSQQKLNRLKPAFLKNGTVTAGNASSLNDGAAFAILVSGKIVEKLNLKPLAVIKEFSLVGLDPNYMGLGAFYAANQCLKKAGINRDDIDLWEINEAFASQTLAVVDLLGIDMSKVNVNGGAIALGHPIGASGSRILATLVHELKKNKLKYGMASLCIGGGQGVSLLIENI